MTNGLLIELLFNTVPKMRTEHERYVILVSHKGFEPR